MKDILYMFLFVTSMWFCRSCSLCRCFCLSPLFLSFPLGSHTTVHSRGGSHARPWARARSRPGQDTAYAAQRMGVYLRCLRQVAGKDWLRFHRGQLSSESGCVCGLGSGRVTSVRGSQHSTRQCCPFHISTDHTHQ